MAPLDGRVTSANAPVQAQGLGCPEEDGEIDFAGQCPETQPCGSRPCYHLDQSRPAAALGDNELSSLIVMTNPDVGTQVSEPEVAETNAHSGPIEGNKAASAPAAKPKAKPRTQCAEANGPAGAADRVVKPKPKPKPHEVLPWLRPR